MFMDPRPSPWDLNFRLGGIPVRVHPMFWLLALILSGGELQQWFKNL